MSFSQDSLSGEFLEGAKNWMVMQNILLFSNTNQNWGGGGKSMHDQESRKYILFCFVFFWGGGVGLEGEVSWIPIRISKSSHFQEIASVGYIFKNPVRFLGKFYHKFSFRGQILREKQFLSRVIFFILV